MADFLFGVEQECLTLVRSNQGERSTVSVLALLLQHLSRQAPSIPGSTGIFQPYGRAYLDGPHFELASAECDDPFILPGIIEQQHTLAAQAVGELQNEGIDILLANDNHSGLLEPGTATWGTHENYLIQQPLEDIADRLLPFLATRIYAGAGGVKSPSGKFVAGVRMEFLDIDRGGGTTSQRAIVSTSRDEALLGPSDSRRRCHLILGDGHRAGFSWALQIGSTALVLRLLEEHPETIQPIPRTSRGQSPFWLGLCRQANCLALPGSAPKVHPQVIAIQRFYLDAVAQKVDLPAWGNRLLTLWDETLTAFAEQNFDWLALRFDPWIKYRLYASWLSDHGASWTDLPQSAPLRAGLALLDQSYHDFTSTEKFTLPETILRTVPFVQPGEEKEPFIPPVATRAAARARFLKENSEQNDLVMDWNIVRDKTNRYRTLYDPFAENYSPWKK